jgi:hypothetical protein
MKLGMIVKAFLAIQFLFVQTALAGKFEFNTQDRMALMTSIPNWNSAFSIVSKKVSKEDIAHVTSKLKDAGIDLNSNMGLVQTGNKLYIGNQEVVISGNQITFNGAGFKYNSSKSFEANYNEFYEKLAKSNHASIINLFITNAYASSKSDLSQKYAGTAALLTFVAFLMEAPAWLIASGVVITAALVGVSVAYAGDLEKGALSIRDFNCIPHGWSLTLSDGKKIDTVVADKDSVFVEITTKDGKKTRNPASEEQSKVFWVNQKVCEAKDSKLISELKQNLTPSGAHGKSDSKNGTR